MKLSKTVRLTSALLAGMVLSLFSANSFALTASGTAINNLATVNYKVGGVTQTAIGSSQGGNTSGAGTPTTFKVDTKLLITVTTNDAADVATTPGQVTSVLSFTVTNNGNLVQGVTFATVQELAGVLASTAGAGFTGTDNFDPTGISVFVANGHGGAYVPATDTASSIPQLAVGASVVVYIVSSIPAAQVDGDVAVEALKGQVTVAGVSATYGTAPGAAITVDDTLSAWTPGTTQQLFADTAGLSGDTDALHDGISSSRDAYIVKSAKLTITKTVVVLSDPTGDAIKHAIPGAVVQYTITIANSATATTAATNIGLTDALPASTTWGTAAVGTLAVTTPGVNTGAQFSCPDGSVTTKPATTGGYTAVSCDFNVSLAANITISGVTLNPNDTTSIVYTVTIN
jgi:uncharacterized repeat protein (TIGR01451 family)